MLARDDSCFYGLYVVRADLSRQSQIEFARLSRVRDIFTGDCILQGVRVMSDGDYFWPNYLAWYVEKYNLRMPEEFERYILEKCK